MPGNCAVGLCKNISKKDSNVHFFRFPKDVSLRNIWIKQCYRKEIFNADTSRVCSDHFEESDFENIMQIKLMGGKKLILKKDSVPKKNLKITIDETATALSKRTMRYKKKQQQLEVDELLKLHSEVATMSNKGLEQLDQNSGNHESLVAGSSPNTINTEIVKLQAKIHDMEKEINVLKEQNEYKDTAFRELKCKYEENRKRLEALGRKLRHLNNKNIKARKHVIVAEVKKVLSQIFTESQIKLLLQKQKMVRWSEKDISLAFTIRYYSKRCYILLRNKLHYPLPGLSTLRSWASKINMRTGVLDGVLNLIQVAGTVMSPIEKLVVLQYDEVKVAEKYEYDQANDEIVGPHKYLQIVNAKTFIRQRIFIKINFLNVQLLQQKINYGKRKCDDRQAGNKLKRLTM